MVGSLPYSLVNFYFKIQLSIFSALQEHVYLRLTPAWNVEKRVNGGLVLPNPRTVIITSPHETFSVPGATVLRDIQELALHTPSWFLTQICRRSTPHLVSWTQDLAPHDRILLDEDEAACIGRPLFPKTTKLYLNSSTAMTIRTLATSPSSSAQDVLSFHLPKLKYLAIYIPHPSTEHTIVQRLIATFLSPGALPSLEKLRFMWRVSDSWFTCKQIVRSNMVIHTDGRLGYIDIKVAPSGTFASFDRNHFERMEDVWRIMDTGPAIAWLRNS